MRRAATKQARKPQAPGHTHRALVGSGENEGGFLRYTVRSAFRALTHVVEVDLSSLAVRCTCEDFQYRRKSAKAVDPADRLCKHIRTFQSAILRDIAQAKADAR